MTKDVMTIQKPIIALLHFAALPSDPLFVRGSQISDIVAQAAHDLDNLQRGGVDAILFSNEFSLPYQNTVSQVTSCTMARIIGELRKDIQVPYGVDLLQDPVNIIDLAVAVDASFVREQFTGAFVGEGGVFNTDIAATLRRRNALDRQDLRMFYFLNAEADVYLNDRSFDTIAKSMIFKCHPDGICISGSHAGNHPDSQWISDVKKVTGETAVFCNTGCNKDNIRDFLSIADGAFVGTAFKKDGKFENTTEERRIREFMDVVNEFRKTL